MPKLLLAVESMVFDVVFMVQHYVLYTDRSDPIAKVNVEAGGSVSAADGGSGDQYEQLHSPINQRDKAADEEEKRASNGYSSHST